MTHQRFHETDQARDCFEKAQEWCQTVLQQWPATNQAEFASLRLETEQVLWPDRGQEQGKVEDAVQAAGISPEHRPFSPHITIARLRETPPHVVAAFERRHQAFACAPFEVTAFHLYESTLTGKGAIHTLVQSYPLKAAT